MENARGHDAFPGYFRYHCLDFSHVSPLLGHLPINGVLWAYVHERFPVLGSIIKTGPAQSIYLPANCFWLALRWYTLMLTYLTQPSVSHP